ncbi:MAG: FKBP-type peptidyl-prolyl cis-trans isomerase [Dysgonamonadaceae bacterium]|jgi:FKBP-type peptidyl-prolyl cis-trans isomerase FklB|nr:FKBP-type peptidyl-prolyl cis-trans isomerase [Dysgonamonadaceae bacterium]
MDKISYALGLSIGNNFKTSGIKGLDIEDFKKGVEAVLKGSDLLLSYDEAKKVISDYFVTLQEEKGKLNKEAGKEFLRINKEKSGVVTLASGLQYQILEEGNGPKPKATDSVKCHYQGTLIDGLEFDSSIKRGQPATFGLNQVIPGWTEALQLMPTGSKWKLFLPSELAYGSGGAGEMIEPDSALIFEVELLEIV